MRKIKYIITSFVIMALFASCNQNNDSENGPGYLYVAHEKVSFGSGEQSRTIEVKVEENMSFEVQWLGDGAWGEVEKNGTGVLITVKKHTGLVERSGSAVIRHSNGKLSKMIEVKQSASDVFIQIGAEYDESEMTFDTPFESVKTVAILSESGQWTASVIGNPNWITLNPRNSANILEVAVTENRFTLMRQAIIEISSGNTTVQITVKQAQAVQFMLPYLDFNANLGRLDMNALKAWEASRGSTYVGYIITSRTHHFNTVSQTFPEMWYYLGMMNMFMMAQARPMEFEVLYSKSYMDFLESEGFVFVWENSARRNYWNEERGVSAILMYSNGEVYFENKKPVAWGQTRPYPTFDEIPYSLMNWDAKKAEVATWEADKDTHVKFEVEDYIEYYPNNDNLELLYRTYAWDAQGMLAETTSTFKGSERAFYYDYNPQLMTYTFTNEFMSLLVKEGFELYANIGTHVVFYHVKKKFVLFVGLINMPINGQNTLCTQIKFRPYDELADVTRSISLRQGEYIEPMKNRENIKPNDMMFYKINIPTITPGENTLKK